MQLKHNFQIKEAYQMSKAMQPVLVTVLIFKFSIIISTDIVFYISMFGNYAVGYNEAVYLLVSQLLHTPPSDRKTMFPMFVWYVVTRNSKYLHLKVTAIYGNCVTVMLMRTHPALRRQTVKIL